MRTNGFALFTGADARSRAEASISRVERFRRETIVERVEAGAAEAFLVALSLEEGRDSFPVVHGLFQNGKGEYAFLTSEGGGLRGGRDALGTRGLYVDSNWSCVGSDHRFFLSHPRLMPRGARMEMGTRSITSVEISSEPSGLSIDEAAQRLTELLKESVRKRVEGKKKVAVSFSGGLDSSLLALLASKETAVVLCSAYAQGSRDKEQTAQAAGALGLEIVTREVGREEVAAEIRGADLPFRPGPMDLALWSLYSTTSRAASEQGAELILLGQLADELFGGYMKYALTARRSPQEAEAMMRADVAACSEVAFIRDEMACARYSEARFPFADEAIASFAYGLPLSYKISGGERKLILRKAASILGLPDSLVGAPKKAAQYSSGIAKLVPPT